MAESVLEALLSGRHWIERKNGLPYIDRDPVIFKWVINYLQNDHKIMKFERQIHYDKFIEELDYWGLISSEELQFINLF